MAATAGHEISENRHQRIVYRPLVLLAPALTVGVLADAWLDVSMVFWLLAFFAVLLGWAALWRRQNEKSASILLLMAVGTFGGMVYHVHWNFFLATELSVSLSPDKRPVALRGLVTDYPRFLPAKSPDSAFEFELPNQWKVPFRIEQIRSGTQWVDASGFTEVYVAGDEIHVRPGEKIRVFAQATCSEGALNPGEFDFANWARGKRRRTFLRANYVKCLSTIERAQGVSAWHPIAEARHFVSQQLIAAVPPRLEGLAETIFLGRRERLADETDEAFRGTGTVHLLALSGLHLGILAMFSYGILRHLPGPVWLPGLCMLVLTLGYVVLVDARPPIVRASILVTSLCIGLMVYRRNSFWNSLAAAWIFVVCWSPTEIFQAGTQLSFVAVATLAWLAGMQSIHQKYDPLKRLIEETRPKPIKWWRAIRRGAMQLVIASLVVWLMTLPLVLLNFHAASPWTVILSPVLVVPMGIALAGILLIVVTSVIAPWATPSVAWMVTGALWFMQTLVEVTQARMPLTFWSAGPPVWWVVGFYAVITLVGCLLLAQRFPIRWGVATVAVWLAVGFAWGTIQQLKAETRDDLTCTFVSVGHGTCVLVELPDGQNLLYDCGRLGSPKRATRSLSAVLWSKGISHLDAVVISHDDADHFNGLPELLERFSIGTVYCSDLMERIPSKLVTILLEDLDSRDIPLRTISAGQRLRTHPEVGLTVLHPTRKGVLGRDNANSIVLLIEYHGRRILLPGDLESPGTEAVILERPIECDVVMAPHHGSRYSNPETFYAWCRPEWIVVSSGSRNIEGPNIEDDDGPQWMNTAENGLVEVRLTKDGLPAAVLSWRDTASVVEE
ncbi:ComEC/Rec2 family competence protein [Bremerella sp. T1]|uniref:ComEC/Rec2 family competence protein n=1 Tax=Bremerella sp. TYQ1 TaxID=3119568 RepID=UPI001CCB953C|nr:ComEC/Rec2 family competence protein [Bremerella volcania]UBM38115.1 ComEC/Rec2 family competence protein [Bremerella volcania]